LLVHVFSFRFLFESQSVLFVAVASMGWSTGYGRKDQYAIGCTRMRAREAHRWRPPKVRTRLLVLPPVWARGAIARVRPQPAGQATRSTGERDALAGGRSRVVPTGRRRAAVMPLAPLVLTPAQRSGCGGEAINAAFRGRREGQ